MEMKLAATAIEKALKPKAVAHQVSAAATKRAEGIIRMDFDKRMFEAGPGGKGFWLPNPDEADDGILMNKISDGLSNLKLTTTSTRGLDTWTATQSTITDYEDPNSISKAAVQGTINIAKKLVTWAKS